MSRVIAGAALLLALAGPAPAAGADDMRFAVRAEVGGAAAWSGRRSELGEGRLALRLGPLQGSVTVDVGQPSSRHPTMLALLRVGAGVVQGLGDWEADGATFMFIRNTNYPDLLGAGRVDLASLGIGVRAGLGRYLGGPERRGKLVPWLGLSASVGIAPPTRYRLQEQRQTGFMALLSVTVGAGLSLRGGAFFPPAPAPP